MGTPGVKPQNEGTSSVGCSPAGEDVPTPYVLSQGDEEGGRGVGKETVLRCHLANKEGDLWATVFPPCCPWLLQEVCFVCPLLERRSLCFS